MPSEASASKGMTASEGSSRAPQVSGFIEKRCSSAADLQVIMKTLSPAQAADFRFPPSAYLPVISVHLGKAATIVPVCLLC